MLADHALKTFIPTTDRPRAIAFYRDLLGLAVVSEDDFGVEFDTGHTRLRLTTVQSLHPQPFTVLGWHVKGIEGVLMRLLAKGVVFERFSFAEQDELGIWTAPGGVKVAWFKDPDGNLLSLDE